MEAMSTLKIAHLSDLHFSSPSFHPSYLLTKRALGIVSLLLFRSQLIHSSHLDSLPSLCTKLGVEHLCITGDFSSLSLDTEFAKAKAFVDSFSQPVHLIPGNHDCYVKSVEKERRFYHFFPSTPLKTTRVEKKSLGKGWWWVGIDAAFATLPFCARGYFTKAIHKELRDILESLPKDENVIIANHFPLYPTSHPLRDLQGAEALQTLLKNYPSVKIYLHGHEHTPYLREARSQGLPLVCNSGSTSHHGTFYLLTLSPDSCLAERIVYHPSSGWNSLEEKKLLYHPLPLSKA